MTSPSAGPQLVIQREGFSSTPALLFGDRIVCHGDIIAR